MWCCASLGCEQAISADPDPTAAREGSGATATTGPSWTRHLDPAWATDARWFEGEAEVGLFEATVTKYGEPRRAERWVHIVVAEDHDPAQLVKADDWRRDDLVPMLKFNSVHEVPTGVYTYQQMLSFFFERSSLHLAKMTLASHEWCGNTFKQLVNFRHAGGDRTSYDFNTYWDGGGQGSYAFAPPADLAVYEALPIHLRALRFAEGLEVTLPLLGPQLSSKASEPLWADATLRVGALERIEVPAGAFEAWPVEMRWSGGIDRFDFEAEAPHRLLRWRQASGDRLDLARSEWMAYWRLTASADTSRLWTDEGAIRTEADPTRAQTE